MAFLRGPLKNRTAKGYHHVYTPYSSLLYKDMPSLMKQTVASTITQNLDLGNALVTNISQGILCKANGYYRNAQRAEHPWGLCQGNVTTIVPARTDQITAVIAADVNKDIYLCNVGITSALDGSYDYFATYYEVVRPDVITDVKYAWVYNTKLGKYPQLELPDHKENSPFYPVTPLRINGVNLGTEGQPHESEIRRALRYLKIKPKQLYEDIAESSKESAEGAPEDMFIVLAVSIASEKKVAKEYLFRFFKRLYNESGASKANYEYWAKNQNQDSTVDMAKGAGVLLTSTLRISDQRYVQELEFDYIIHQIITTEVREVGEYKLWKDGGEILADLSGDWWSRSTETLQLTYQITPTQAESVTVHGLVNNYQVCAGGWVSVTLGQAFGNPDDAQGGQAFVIPLRKDIMEDMGSIKSHDILYQAIRLHSNDHYSKKKKWYEKGWFKVVLVIIAIVATVLGQAHIGVALFSMAMVTAVVTSLVINMIIGMIVMPILTNLVGEKFALLLTVLAMAMGAHVDPSSLTLTMTPTFFTAANAALHGITSIYQHVHQREMKKIQEENEGVLDDLQELNDEKLEDAYNVNVVMNGLDADPYSMLLPSNYVQIKMMESQLPLMLPKTVKNYVHLMLRLDLPPSVIKKGVNA